MFSFAEDQFRQPRAQRGRREAKRNRRNDAGPSRPAQERAEPTRITIRFHVPPEAARQAEHRQRGGEHQEVEREVPLAELFGVERGAATGVEARPGLFEQAHGGSLFLDEVGDTAAETQVRLLRALEDGRLVRVGGRKPVVVDVRVIAATNRDLDAEVAAGRFRLDLYHRLAGHTARIPPLRERPEDIAPLALHFFRQALAGSGRRSAGITAAALLALQQWRWPGNVRELRQAIERAAILLDDGGALDREHLPQALRGGPPPGVDALLLDTALARAEREALILALTVAGGEHERAWALLGIGKTSFYKKLREHGLGRGGDDA